MRSPTQNLDPIGLAGFTFIGYKQTASQAKPYIDADNFSC